MSDSTAYDVAADLADFFATQAPTIDLPADCTVTDRIYAAAGEPAVQPNCPEIVTWIAALGPTSAPNLDDGLGEPACAQSTYVEVSWRLTYCYAPLDDPKEPNPVAVMEADSACFNTILFGLWRRLQQNLGAIFDGQTDCKKISQGRLEVGRRAGGIISATQTLRVQVDVTEVVPAS